MADIIQLDPVYHWPKLAVLDVGNDNNKDRGRFFYLDRDGTIHGPFMTRHSAKTDMMNLSVDPTIPMRQPFQHGALWWWKKDMPEGVEVAGPHLTLFDAQEAINTHIQDLKDRANVYR